MRTAIFPGSFDPFTRGHAALVEQALDLFDKVVIAIGENINKNSLLDAEQRERLIRDYYAGNQRVEVIRYSTLTGEVARRVGATAIIRGLRNTIDFEYERTMAQTNRRIFPDLQSVMLFTPAEYSDISSSTVRELRKFGRSIEEMMPEGIVLENYIREE